MAATGSPWNLALPTARWYLFARFWKGQGFCVSGATPSLRRSSPVSDAIKSGDSRAFEKSMPSIFAWA